MDMCATDRNYTVSFLFGDSDDPVGEDFNVSAGNGATI
jgi:hypothetical protein